MPATPLTATRPARRARRGSARARPRRARPHPRSAAVHASASASSSCTSASSDARRRALALERLDPAQPPQYRACLVHRPNVAGQFARVCVRTVPKGIRFVPSVAASPDRDLGEARAAIDRGDSRAALKSLDRARKGYARALDSEGLEHVLDMAALVDASDDRSRIGRENLAYAVKQNLRQESRRRARQLGRPWTDPFPDLQAPTEHTGFVLTRGVKLWIGIGVLVASPRSSGSCSSARAGRHGPGDDRHAAARERHRPRGHRARMRRRKLRHGAPRHDLDAGRAGRCRRSTRTGWCRSSGSSSPARTTACRFAFTTPTSGSAESGALAAQALAGDTVPGDDRAPAARRTPGSRSSRRPARRSSRPDAGGPRRAHRRARPRDQRGRRGRASRRPPCAPRRQPLLPAGSPRARPRRRSSCSARSLRGLAEQHRRPHRGRPQPVGPAEQRGQRLAQLLRAERLVREQRQLPAVERLRELRILLGPPEPREQVRGEPRAEGVEPRRLARWLGRGDRQHRADRQRPPVEPLEQHRARRDRRCGRQAQRADRVGELARRVGRLAARWAAARARARARRAGRARGRSPAGSRPFASGQCAASSPAAATRTRRPSRELDLRAEREPDERRDGGVGAALAEQRALELGVRAVERLVAPVEAAAGLGDVGEQRQHDRPQQRLVAGLAGVRGGVDRRRRLAAAAPRSRASRRRARSAARPAPRRRSGRAAGTRTASSARARRAPRTRTGARRRRRRRPRAARSPRDRSSAGSGRGAERARPRVAIYAPGGSSPLWQPGHQ